MREPVSAEAHTSAPTQDLPETWWAQQRGGDGSCSWRLVGVVGHTEGSGCFSMKNEQPSRHSHKGVTVGLRAGGTLGSAGHSGLEWRLVVTPVP